MTCFFCFTHAPANIPSTAAQVWCAPSTHACAFCECDAVDDEQCCLVSDCCDDDHGPYGDDDRHGEDCVHKGYDDGDFGGDGDDGADAADSFSPRHAVFYPGRYPAPQACQQRLCKRPLLFIMVCSGLADDRKNPAQKCTAVVCTVSAPLRSEFKARGMAQYFQSKVQAERTSAGERHSQGFTRASCNRTQRSWPDSRHQESKRCQASFDHLNFMSFRRFPASHARHWPLVESV